MSVSELEARTSTVHQEHARAAARVRSLEAEVAAAFLALDRAHTHMDAAGYEVRVRLEPWMQAAYDGWRETES